MGTSLLVGIVGMDGIAMAGIDHAFNRVVLASFLLLALPGELKKVLMLALFLIVSPDIMYSDRSFRVRLEAADASTIAS